MQPSGVAVPQAQQLRLRKDNAASKPVVSKEKAAEIIKKLHHQSCLLKDTNLRLTRPGWTPSFLVAFRIIILFRFFAAMYSSISDCDEVYNYWEPLHYLQRGNGFQTWEYSPEYGIRSWLYILVNSLPGFVVKRFPDKRLSFFLLRICFASISSVVEALFYRSIVLHISPHVARYALFVLACSSGMFSASTAFLPSTFAMWGVMLATAAALSPVNNGWKRIGFVGFCYGVAAFVGWPFVAILALPPIAEQLSLQGNETIPASQEAKWYARRCRNLFYAGAAAFAVLIPIVGFDSYSYKKLVIVPYNILAYNLPGIFDTWNPPEPLEDELYHGPNLYGTAPVSFYFLNGFLAFNIFFVLALLSVPAIFVTHFIDLKRFGDPREYKAEHTPPETNLFARLAPFYLWLIAVSVQEHKEERFLYPAYGLIALNSATTLYLARGWLESAYLRVTKSPWRSSQTALYSTFTRLTIIAFALISFARITALHSYYHAPMTVYHHFQTAELPRLAVSAFPHIYPKIASSSSPENLTAAIAAADETIDLRPLGSIGLRLCLGKEWHRFPSHYLVPDEVEVRFIESEFKGILPKIWEEPGSGKGLFGRATAVIPSGMNNVNQEERDRYVPLSTCSYLIDLSYPHREPTPLEPDYANSPDWDRVFCRPFLDNEASSRLTRAFKLPLPGWQDGNKWGDYCLLRRKSLQV